MSQLQPERAAYMPVTAQEMAERGWDVPDFVYVSGDAYVDHPSFGPALICPRAGTCGLSRGDA